MKKSLLLLSLLFLATQSQAEGYNLNNRGSISPDTPWEEAEAQIPPYTQADWAVLDMPDQIKMQIFIDKLSLQPGADGVVRFSLRQLSAKGVENISHEGIHCNQRTYRSYAFADTYGKRWIVSTRSNWQKLTMHDAMRRTLLNNVCPGQVFPRDTDAILRNLNKDTLKPNNFIDVD